MEDLNQKLNTGIKEIQNIKMIEAESERMFKNILNSPIPVSRSIKSYFGFYSFFSSKLWSA